MLVSNDGFLRQIISGNKKIGLEKKISIVMILAGALLASLGVLHFVPQWTHIPGWTINVSYMTLTQLSLNSVAFSALIIGTAVVFMIVAKLVQNKVIKYLSKKDECDEDIAPFNVRTITKYLAIAAITAAITITLLILGTHALNNLNTGLLTLPSGQPIMAVSETQLFSIIGFGTSGAAVGGIGIYALARLIYLLMARILKNENPKIPTVMPYSGHEV